MADFIVTASPDDFTIVDNTEDWVIFTDQNAEYTVEFQAVALNDTAIVIAAKIAAQAAADAAAADAAQTAEDRIQTGADAAATAADAIATAADRVQTGADAAATSADAIATAADRVQTGLDAAATSADAIATAADRVQTGLDAATAVAAAALATSVIPAGGAAGEVLAKASGADYDYAWLAVSGLGDMVAAVYDPTNIAADAFARANHTGTQLASTISDFSTAADARVSAAIGTTVQAYSANLTTWAGIAPSANAQSFVSAANYAAMRALLDLEAGTDFLAPSAIAAAYQPIDTDLTAIAALTTTGYGRALLTLADDAALQSYIGVRQVLTANRTYYVRTDGSDSNTGLVNDAGGAFLTIQKAINVVKAIDLAGFVITIQVGVGTYTDNIIVDTPWLGGAVVLRGDTAIPGNVNISHNTYGAFSVSNTAVLSVEGIAITNSAAGDLGQGILVATNAVVDISGNMTFGACTRAHIEVVSGGTVNVKAGYSIAGNANYHWLLNHGSLVLSGQTITLSGAPVFNIFVNASNGAGVTVYQATFVGSATGQRYNVVSNAVINPFTASETYFPGSAPGTKTSGGVYNILLAGVREMLTANRTYYVRTDGSNSNNGLANTSGGAFLTIQKAYDVIAASLDLAGFTVTIQVGAGTYTAGLTVSSAWTGGGEIILLGDEVTPANVTLTAGRLVDVSATLPGALRVRGFKHAAAPQTIYHVGVGPVYFRNINFAATGFAQIQAGSIGAKIWIEGNYTISAGATSHCYIAQQGCLQGVVGASITVTIVGTPAFTIFMSVSELALVRYSGVTFSGAATGSRYYVSMNSVIITDGGGASYFPGNSAGTIATGGQYA